MTNKNGQIAEVQPLFYYQWVNGVSLKYDAIVQNGKTFLGPVLVGSVVKATS